MRGSGSASSARSPTARASPTCATRSRSRERREARDIERRLALSLAHALPFFLRAGAFQQGVPLLPRYAGRKLCLVVDVGAGELFERKTARIPHMGPFEMGPGQVGSLHFRRAEERVLQARLSQVRVSKRSA